MFYVNFCLTNSLGQAWNCGTCLADAPVHVQHGVQRKSVRGRRAKVDGRSKNLAGLADTVHELLRIFGRKYFYMK